MDLLGRLENITKKDKDNNPKCLLEIIKSDFFYLISNYFEVDFNDIDISIGEENNKYTIDVRCWGDRIKLMRSIPE